MIQKPASRRLSVGCDLHLEIWVSPRDLASSTLAEGSVQLHMQTLCIYTWIGFRGIS